MTELTMAEALAARDDVVARAVDGEKIDPAEYEAAEQAITRAKMAADLESARAKGSKLRAEQSQIVALTEKAKVLRAEYEAALDTRIAAAARVDDAIEAVASALHDFHHAGFTMSAAVTAIVGHNTAVRSHLPVTNATLAALAHAPRPYCPHPYPDNGAAPIIKPEHELFEVSGFGWDKKRREVHSLEAHERLHHRRPHVRENAA
jgi:hypothetical protein